MVDERPGRGRPRDPTLDGRVLDAALAEYARTGWAAFTVDAVIRQSGVGKSALYRRWPTKERLLADAIESYTKPVVAEYDTGTLRGDLLAVATTVLAHLLGPVGWVTLRIFVDAAVDTTDFGRFNDRLAKTFNDPVARMLDRAQKRGELAAEIPIQTVTDALFGAILIHALALAPTGRDEARTHLVEHVTPVVDFILRGAGVPLRAASEPRVP